MKYLRYTKLLIQLGYTKMWIFVAKLLGVPRPRPWTYEIRDWSSRHELWTIVIAAPVTAAFILGQMELVIAFGWLALPFVLWADFMAFVAGHLFWDTRGKYLPK